MRLNYLNIMPLLFLVVACQSTPTPVEDAAAPPLKLPVVAVIRRDLPNLITIPGTVNALPDHSVKVSPAVAGKLIRVYVVPGQQVSPGQLLAQLDNRQATAQINQATASLQATKAGVAQAQTNLLLARNTQARLQTLFDQKIAPQKDLIAARSQVESALEQLSAAQAQVAVAQATVAQNRAQFTFTQLRSPLRGVVAQRFLNAGDTADPAQPVVQIVDLSTVIVRASLAADTPTALHQGQTAQIISTALGGVKLAGRVIAISPVVDPQNNTLGVQLRVANPQGRLKENQAVTVNIIAGVHRAVLTVPQTALVPNPDQPNGQMVYGVKAGHVQRIAVQTGLEQNDQVEVSGQLQAGQLIVARGAYGLPDGTALATGNTQP